LLWIGYKTLPEILSSTGNTSESSKTQSVGIYIYSYIGRPRGLIGSTLNHIWLPPEFECRRGHIWRVFRLWLRFITFGGCSVDLAHNVQNQPYIYIYIYIYIMVRNWPLAILPTSINESKLATLASVNIWYIWRP